MKKSILLIFSILALLFVGCQSESMAPVNDGVDYQTEIIDGQTKGPQYSCDGNYPSGDYWQIYYDVDQGTHMICSGIPWTCSSVSTQFAQNRCQAQIRGAATVMTYEESLINK